MFFFKSLRWFQGRVQCVRFYQAVRLLIGALF